MRLKQRLISIAMPVLAILAALVIVAVMFAGGRALWRPTRFFWRAPWATGGV